MKADKKHRILLVEDDSSLGYLLTEYLQIKGLQVSWVTNGNQALQILRKEEFDLAVLDVMMPEMDGFALAEQLRKDHPRLQYIFLTAKSLKIDVLKGFSLGAFDYLKKPIDEEELVIRIEALLARIGTEEDSSQPTQSIHLGSYTYDSRNQELSGKGKLHKLTARENDLLYYLATHRNSLCSHKEILLGIWGKNDYFNKKSLNVFITRLRKFLKDDPRIRIENVHGQGYILRFQPD